jgi:hypothetical protein
MRSAMVELGPIIDPQSTIAPVLGAPPTIPVHKAAAGCSRLERASGASGARCPVTTARGERACPTAVSVTRFARYPCGRIWGMNFSRARMLTRSCRVCATSAEANPSAAPGASGVSRAMARRAAPRRAAPNPGGARRASRVQRAGDGRGRNRPAADRRSVAQESRRSTRHRAHRAGTARRHVAPSTDKTSNCSAKSCSASASCSSSTADVQTEPRLALGGGTAPGVGVHSRGTVQER